jgi:ring-1,2-phenylacetyl-CoA epoxidase subunit PaaD
MSASADIISLVEHEQWERKRAYTDKSLAPLFQILEQVKDPEIPALSIWDMGILRSIDIESNNDKNKRITVVITPTYSGCPAMDLIRQDIHSALDNAGYTNVEVTWQLLPTWTTAWMSDDAKAKMTKSGIAPPQDGIDAAAVKPQCPVCGSKQTQLISEFGSTACKALYRCESCLEPFDYFKAF